MSEAPWETATPDTLSPAEQAAAAWFARHVPEDVFDGVNNALDHPVWARGLVAAVRPLIAREERTEAAALVGYQQALYGCADVCGECGVCVAARPIYMALSRAADAILEARDE